MTDKTTMAVLTAEMVDAAVAAPALGLKVLLAEMQALTQVLPGSACETDAQLAAHEAAVESDFDNMPV